MHTSQNHCAAEFQQAKRLLQKCRLNGNGIDGACAVEDVIRRAAGAIDAVRHTGQPDELLLPAGLRAVDARKALLCKKIEPVLRAVDKNNVLARRAAVNQPCSDARADDARAQNDGNGLLGDVGAVGDMDAYGQRLNERGFLVAHALIQNPEVFVFLRVCNIQIFREAAEISRLSGIRRGLQRIRRNAVAGLDAGYVFACLNDLADDLVAKFHTGRQVMQFAAVEPGVGIRAANAGGEILNDHVIFAACGHFQFFKTKVFLTVIHQCIVFHSYSFRGPRRSSWPRRGV